ncbi:response regulator [Massilia sp. 9096]|uniref:response regulator n=1 Tax=Massilia sp. 9096 TaxID=1500894 RepID=UPI00068A48BB|nr:response regulator [Massilia sp. 9096]
MNPQNASPPAANPDLSVYADATKDPVRASRTYRELLRLFEQAPGFVTFFRGSQHVYELQNGAHHRLAGYRDIIGKPVREALPELAGQRFFELLDGVFQTGVAYVGTALPLEITPAGGGPAALRYIDFVYQPIVDESGAVVGVFSQGNDVTERVIAEEALRRKQEELERMVAARTEALAEAHAALKLAGELQGDKTHLQRLFEQAPGFICVLRGPEHSYELANAAYRRLIGGRDLIGKVVRAVLPELEGQGFFELLDDVYRTAKPFIGRAVPLDLQVDGDGPLQRRYLDFIYQPVLDPTSEVIGIFVQGSDVTEQKQTQDELARHQTELESLVQERTQELVAAQDALQRSQKLESIGKLTGGVAHDFNNILQVVGGNLELLQRRMPDGDAQALLQVAQDAVTRGAKLSSQLLAFARRQPLQPVVVNPARVVGEMDDLLRRALGETIAIETVKSGGLWNTVVDPNQLENVILNLAINARDAMAGEGKLTIEIGNAMLDDAYVSFEPDIKPGQYVMIAVSDTGSGMTREVMERACEPFFTTKPEGVGTGLGLSMAYGFVKQTGGHFKIYSEVGHGTTIKLYFPRSFESEATVTRLAGGKIEGGSETVLVVEDDPAVQATVVELLGSLGYRVLKADNAADALGIVKSGLPIDLLFTDVVMPGTLRSPELARQAKALQPKLAVLFTSGYTQNAIVHGGRLDPGVELLSKPYGREQLARKIRHLLANRSVPAAPAPDAEPEANKVRILVAEDNQDLLEMACRLFEALGQDAHGAASVEDALAVLAAQPVDVLFTDIDLAGQSGVDLARRARALHPQVDVVFASGYGAPPADALQGGFRVVPKPYRLEDLRALLQQVATMRA